ncbi:NTP transferase domain-containing protein [Methanobrevibacter olleyae]|uniref:GTP:adenosylcobinamide-phosphate guanylyltransferase CobY n=1 Tax=Methanobrevibacter olleyae TaxID=294671 RepID=A0A126R2P4_METOL|nr:NTP transferase domain-containing protein [Methanobrevibacter olleyae]AMK15925.1 GTP:adenosylcobinamide-phosphate guanylyltransferase CobY [Methanobrevibacter olleyae]SFL15535.1 TIGR00454 family protein [Methanobrevibacter olleyae]
MIIALVMAGGKGLRLKADIEKPLFPINNKPLIKHVLDNINESKLIEKTVVAVSPNAKNTKDFLINDLDFSSFDDSFYDSEEKSFYLDTLGKGFVEDLSNILEIFESKSRENILIFINADLPLVNGEILDEILTYYLNQDKPALSTLVPVEIFEEYGIEYSYEFNGKVPSGINILRSENVVQEEEFLTISRYELAFNINTIDIAILTTKFL